jgi:hypothetical protein
MSKPIKKHARPTNLSTVREEKERQAKAAYQSSLDGLKVICGEFSDLRSRLQSAIPPQQYKEA